MKGGKGGRKRSTSTSRRAASPSDRHKPKKGSTERPANAPPKKGSRKKNFGPVSPDDER